MITSLKSSQVFVFGSNANGFHDGGAAKYALENFGAVYGQFDGLQGQSYALPTMSRNMKPYSLGMISRSVSYFLWFAREHPKLEFLVSRIACGIAGYTDEEIAPFFRNSPKNVYLPFGWKELATKRPVLK